LEGSTKKRLSVVVLESENPGVRFLALRDLLELPAEDRELKSARKSLIKMGDCGCLIQDGERGYGSSRVPVIPKNTVPPFGRYFIGATRRVGP